MLTVHQTPDVALTARASSDIEADLLIFPVFEDDALADEPGLDAASGGEVDAARARGEITGKAFSLFVTPLPGWKATYRCSFLLLKQRVEAAAGMAVQAAAIGGG